MNNTKNWSVIFAWDDDFLCVFDKKKEYLGTIECDKKYNEYLFTSDFVIKYNDKCLLQIVNKLKELNKKIKH
jgi:hypothetical protein